MSGANGGPIPRTRAFGRTAAARTRAFGIAGCALALALAACARGEVPLPSTVILGEPMRMPSAIGDAPQTRPALVADRRGALHAVWVEESREGGAIVYGRWTTEERQLSRPVVVRRFEAPARTLAPDERPALAVGLDGTIDVAWIEREDGRGRARVARSVDDGERFGKPLEPAETASARSAERLALAAGPGDQLALAWLEGPAEPASKARGLVLALSPDGGRLWESHAVDAQPTAGARPSVSFSPRGVGFVAWRDASGGVRDLYVQKMSDDANLIGSGERARISREAWRTDDAPAWSAPVLAIGPRGRQYVAWADPRHGNGDVFLSASGARAGVPFSVPRRTHQGTDGRQRDPAIAVDEDGRVVAVWVDGRGDRPQIFLTTTQDGGATFTQERPVTREAHRPPQSDPSVAAGYHGSTIVAWAEGAPGATRIFLAFGVLAPDPVK